MNKNWLTEGLDRDTAISLGYKYLNGDEENGIFIDYEKAKNLFDYAEWEEDTEERIDPNCDLLIADYYLKGDSITINCIKEMVEYFTIRFGTPDNEDGLFVPIEVLMQLLVGTPYYHGNLLKMEDGDDGSLILRVEAETVKPLLYAMRFAFTNLQIKMKEISQKT